ncbi:MAG: AAC(3) family N-acetyltransferase [Myxococcota bacterium]
MAEDRGPSPPASKGAGPLAPRDLVRDLHHLGVALGETLLVHTSLRALARGRLVLGGPVGVILALQDAVGPEGLLLMPTFTAPNREPRFWSNPPVPEAHWAAIRAGWPAFRKDRTPSFGVGRVPEVFRGLEDVVRSEHPQQSFAAWGSRAAWLAKGQPLVDAFGEASPLRRLEDDDGRVLMLGTGWGAFTAFHLAERRMARPLPQVDEGAAMLDAAGVRRWRSFRAHGYRADDFHRLGRDLEATNPEWIRRGRVGEAQSRLVRVRPAIAAATRWLDRHR